MMGIYFLAVPCSGECYIGSSVNIDSRLSAHFWMLGSRSHPNGRLQAAYDKHGVNGFQAGVLEPISVASALIPSEQRWMDEIEPEFNIHPLAGWRAPVGVSRPCTEETRRRISDALKGRPLSSTTRAKMRERAIERSNRIARADKMRDTQ